MDAVFRLADRLTVMVEGAVIAAGTAAEISANEAVKIAYLGGEE
jgi:branched-chain amino acid transport system ATP-binding protein